MNIYLIIILAIIFFDYCLNLSAQILNLRRISPNLPKEFEGCYDAQKYKHSQEYLKMCTHFQLVQDGITKAVILAFILFGGFNLVDQYARGFNFGPIATGLVFAGILMLAGQMIILPFWFYHTFVIEQKYGFNRTTAKTFFLDMVKSLILGAIIGGVAYAAVIWFFLTKGKIAWVYCWVAITMGELFLLFIAPVVIFPLFNKFTPLEKAPSFRAELDKEQFGRNSKLPPCLAGKQANFLTGFTPIACAQLKQAIQEYVKNEHFRVKGIFTMDGSRRTAKSNAFFTGFGKFRRIVLFDTLLAKQKAEEIVSVLAHEVGHYKKHHLLKLLTLSILTKAVMFYLLSLFINNPYLFAAFKMENLSVYASLFFFAFLYAPLNLIFSIFSHWICRKQEYQADRYCVATYQNPEALISALKKLSVDNFSNLNPHPLKVFLDYHHPPVLARINAIKALQAKS